MIDPTSVLRALARTLVLLLLGGNLAATWSIILVDTRTGEVAIGSATCLTGWDLRRLTAVLVVGKGGACAQSYVDFSGRNRLVIFQGFRNGTSPKDILTNLALSDNSHQTRQYGIVDTQGRAIGFSGTGAANWKGDITGQFGSVVYAIQGNILTGAAVVNAAEAAVRGTSGDLATKLMAGMEAARKMGGDGRCSCSVNAPTSCGAPPASFRKSADIGFMMVGRIGDTDGRCDGNVGCAEGRYYMNLNVSGNANDPDPVLTLKTMFDAWRKSLAGRPDHHLSTLTLPTGSLPADAATGTVATLTLRDVEGNPLGQSAAHVRVTLDPSSTASLTIGTPRDNRDGTYAIPLRSGGQTGLARLRIEVDDDRGATVTLAPFTDIRVTTDRLWVSNEQLLAARGGDLEFVINQGSAHAGRPYMLLASNSGTSPGLFLPPNQRLPLNPDALFWTVLFASNTALPGFSGTLDQTGRRTIRLPMPPGLYAMPVPSELSFAAILLTPLERFSNPVSIQLLR